MISIIVIVVQDRLILVIMLHFIDYYLCSFIDGVV